jgi:glycosyltransferase involved in cell wall biosynthesis
MESFGVPADRLNVIPNGVSGTEWRAPLESERVGARLKLGLPAETALVAFVGALAREKGPDIAVETVAALPGAHLLIVGDGPEESVIREAATRSINGRVTFLRSTSSLWDVYAATDVLLVPSRTECMPAVVLEASLMGVPAVSTSVGALRCLIEAGAVGVVVDSNDSRSLACAVRSILEGENDYPRMDSEARAAFLEQFGMEAVSDKWSAVLKDADVKT